MHKIAYLKDKIDFTNQIIKKKAREILDVEIENHYIFGSDRIC